MRGGMIERDTGPRAHVSYSSYSSVFPDQARVLLPPRALSLSLIIVFKIIRTPMEHSRGDRHILRTSH